MEDFEQLSEEELRRQREVARRRRMAAKERRRKKRLQKLILHWSILILVVVLFIVGMVKGIGGIYNLFHDKKVEKQKQEELLKNPPTTQATTEAFEVDEEILAKEKPTDRDAALAELEKIGETDAEIKNIYENAAVYSDKVLINLAANTELKPFTIDYLTKVNTVYDGNFSLEIANFDVPLFLQYDAQWGYADYGDSLLAYNGSAPTCVAMAYNYLKRDGSPNPITIGDSFMAAGYVNEKLETSWEAMTKGVEPLGLQSTELSVNEENMKAALDSDKIIICCMNDGDFTKGVDHFIVITGYSDYKFYVADPSSLARSQIAWPFERLSTQIKNMWALSADLNAGSSGNDTTSGDTSTNNDDSTNSDGSTNGDTSTNGDGSPTTDSSNEEDGTSSTINAETISDTNNE